MGFWTFLLFFFFLLLLALGLPAALGLGALALGVAVVPELGVCEGAAVCAIEHSDVNTAPVMTDMITRRNILNTSGNLT